MNSQNKKSGGCVDSLTRESLFFTFACLIAILVFILLLPPENNYSFLKNKNRKRC